jgi:DNA-binding transcriptional LysR family regulator
MATIPQMKSLIDGTLDVGFARAPDRYPAGLTGFLVDRQQLCLAIPEGHPLASRIEVEPEMLVGEPLVATLLEMEMGFWSNIRAVAPPNVPMRIVARVSDPFSELTMVAAGVGLGVVSDSLRHIAIPGVVYRNFSGATRSADHVVVFRKNEGTPVVKAFVSLLRARARSA